MEANSEKTPKSWQEKRSRRLMLISPSQCETFDQCRRKWWLNKVRGLPTPKTSSQVFGTVLHSVCERYLKADGLGRDVAGNPVNLYPAGWHIAESRFDEPSDGEIGLLEQDQVKKLIAAAIESGVLERRPGRQVEVEFRRDVLQPKCPECDGVGVAFLPVDGKDAPCECCNGDGKGTRTQVIGVIDCLLPDGVQDHKTTKDMKYAKSPEKLKTNIQMLIYGYELLARLAGDMPSQITLRHNVFCKDRQKPQVRKVETQVTIHHLTTFWNDRLVPMATEMEKLRRTADQWHEVPEPASQQEACNAYGGCPFRTICSGQESEQGYQDRMSRVENKKVGEPTVGKTGSIFNTGIKGGSYMASAFAARLAQKAKESAAANTAPPPAVNPTPVAAPPPAAAPVTEVRTIPHPVVAEPNTPEPMVQPAAVAQAVSVAEPVAGTEPPPWAIAGCPACKGVGFNSRGKPCMICDTKQGALTNPAGEKIGTPSLQFTLEAVGNGTCKWTYKADPTITGVCSMTAATAQEAPAPVKTTERSSPPAAAPAQGTQPAPEAAPPVAEATESEPTPDPVTRGVRGRPRKGFILCINCRPVNGFGAEKSGRYVHDLSDTLHLIGKQMVIESNKCQSLENQVESFYELQAFARRDALAACAPKLVESFNTDLVIAEGVGSGMSDLKALTDALRPYAGMIIESTGN
jgi:RecB family exonuclease